MSPPAAAALAGGLPVDEVRRCPQLLLILARAELVFDDRAAVMATLTRLQQVQPLAAKALRQVGEELEVADREDFQGLLPKAPAK